MKMHALRLTSGNDLLLEIEKYISAHSISIGVILSAVGDVSEAKLLNSKTMDSSRIREPMDIVGISGTVSQTRTHLHITFSRKNFTLIGGHLPHGCYVGDSVEIIIGEFNKNEAIDRTAPSNIGEEAIDLPEEKETEASIKEDFNEYDSLVTNLFKR